MAASKGETLTHLYGIGSLVPGLISVYFLVQADASWREYALVASGWVAAIFYALMLVKAFGDARRDGESIGSLEGQIKALQKELDGRNILLEYFAGIQMGKVATPRSTTPSVPSDEDSPQ